MIQEMDDVYCIVAFPTYKEHYVYTSMSIIVVFLQLVYHDGEEEQFVPRYSNNIVATLISEAGVLTRRTKHTYTDCRTYIPVRSLV
jgi:hypothetical protein